MQQSIPNTKHRALAILGVLALIGSIVLSVLAAPMKPVSAQSAASVFRVNAQGQITKDGVVFPIRGGSWFGLEGRHEPSNDPTNPSGAPMEQYIGNVFWQPSNRTIAGDLAEMKALGINMIRLPLSPQTLTGTDPQGMDPFLKNNPSVRIANSRLAVETIIKAANTAGIMILLDLHSCSNYLGWRAGRLDARPPYVDATRENYDFKRENASCASTGNPAGVTKIQPYDETKWLADLRTLAGLESALGVGNIIGIDIFNEPWDYSWAEWKGMSERAYTAINAVNPNILIFVQGIGTSSGNQDGSPTTITQTPHGDVASNPNWGENLYEAGANIPNIPQSRLVFSPHTYGPSVFVQKMFMDPAQPACAGLEGDAAGDARCKIVINPTLLRAGWEEHFGYLKAMGYAVVIGEYGGNMVWPRGTSNLRDQARYSYLTDNTVDEQWQNAFVDYLISACITDSIYWSINPESGDTGGIYTHAYDPISNTAGWGTWGSFDSKKVTLLQRLWSASTTCNSGPTVTPGGPTLTNTPVTPSPTPVVLPNGVWRVNPVGQITKDGVVYPIRGGSWFGLEGRHEPSNDPTNPSGAPMEQYIGNVFWQPSNRTIAGDLAEMKALGINMIRLPLSPQTLTGTDPQGMDPYLKNNPSVRIANSRLALETIIKAADTAGIAILLDLHSCSNYLGWRAGRLDARPPYVDATRENYDFKRENASCASTNNPAGVTKIQPYDETKWLADLRTLAGMSATLNVNNIMGIDIFNEPWDYSWAEWKGLSERAYTAINAVNPNLLVIVQGIGTSSGNQDGSPTTITQTPHGDVATNPNWGENLYEAGANLPNIPQSRIVFSPHTYGPSVFVQKMFMDPAQPQCAGLEGDAAGDARCKIVINPTLLRAGWQEHFGYLKAMGYAVMIGEYGGNMVWPRGTSNLRDQARYSYLTDNTVDEQWQNAFVDYLISACITDSVYWSINPESGDTGGIYTHAYDPISNTGGWGTWGAFDSKKVTLLNRLWNATPTNCSTTPVITPTPTSTATKTRTATKTPTRTRTITPGGPTFTKTRTPTKTNTPTKTATRTITATATNTPVASFTPTPTATSSVACSPVTATISAPFSQDGAGTFCWQSSNLGNYINNWNLSNLTVNGVNLTSQYVASGSYPAKVGGFWYISYTSAVAWGHFEAK